MVDGVTRLFITLLRSVPLVDEEGAFVAADPKSLNLVILSGGRVRFSPVFVFSVLMAQFMYFL